MIRENRDKDEVDGPVPRDLVSDVRTVRRRRVLRSRYLTHNR
jgi:hypothetical protein